MTFDNGRYLKLQPKHTLEWVSNFDSKLYLEFGGKLFDDHHVARVLPRFQPDNKLEVLLGLKEGVEIVIAVLADDIEENKIRSDMGVTYDVEMLRLIDVFRDTGLYVGSVVIIQHVNQASINTFKTHLEHLGAHVYLYYPIARYPNNILSIVSDEGYGKNEYIEAARSSIAVTAPGPSPGKMAIHLPQFYHEHEHEIKAGYAKFETFPIWNLPLKYPVNLAYEAATADLNDINMIGPFHLRAYGETIVDYSRDVEISPVLNVMFEKILETSPYKSPMDMGASMAGYCIMNDEITKRISGGEIIRRYYRARVDYKKGHTSEDIISKIEIIMSQVNTQPEKRNVVKPVLDKFEEIGVSAVAIELLDGRIVAGKTASLLGANSAILLNALKTLGNINGGVPLISPNITEPIQRLKANPLGNHNLGLHTNEILIALSTSIIINPASHLASQQLDKLKNCGIYSTVILSQVDASTLYGLSVNLTCGDGYQAKKSCHG